MMMMVSMIQITRFRHLWSSIRRALNLWVQHNKEENGKGERGRQEGKDENAVASSMRPLRDMTHTTSIVGFLVVAGTIPCHIRSLSMIGCKGG